MVLISPPQGPRSLPAPSTGLIVGSNFPSSWIGLLLKCDWGLSSKWIRTLLSHSSLPETESAEVRHSQYACWVICEPAPTERVALPGQRNRLFLPISFLSLSSFNPDASWHWHRDSSTRKPPGFPPTFPHHHTPFSGPGPAELILSVMKMNLQVSVVSIKAQQCERDHVLFLRCLYWVKYELLCNSWPSSWSSLHPSGVFVHVSVMACFHRYLSDMSLWLSTLFPMGQWIPYEEYEGGSLICVCAHLPGLPQFS